MRWLVTLCLLGLVGAGVAWLVAEDRLREALKLPRPVADSGTATLSKLQQLTPVDIQELKLTPPGHGPLTLTKAADGSWSQPGNWPLREAEVSALLNTLTTLRTRFAAIPLNPDKPDLAPYGLDQPSTMVEVVVDLKTARGKETVRLSFGQPAGTATSFDRPCFVRVDTLNEVLRLGPDVFPLLSRSPEVYRRRQLLPDVERVKFAGDFGLTSNAGRLPLIGDQFTQVTLEKFGESPVKYTLKRVAPTPTPKREPNRTGEPSLSPNALAAAWQLDYGTAAKPPLASVTITDRPDPTKLKTILTTLPELWVEGFVPPGNVTLEAAGLAQPQRTITLTRSNGKNVVLLIGKEIRTTTRTEASSPPPSPFGAPPPPPKLITETFHYAKLQDNDLIFELRTDKLNDLFNDPAELRDAQLARYEPSDVVGVKILPKGQPPIVLTKKRGDKDAEKDDDKQDRWYIGELLADNGKVSDLLDPLSRLEAKGKENILDGVDATKLKELELTEPRFKIVVTIQPEVAKGDTPPAPKELTYELGKVDAKKLNVRVSGWERVNVVDDAIVQWVERPALAYRSRRLFDTTDWKLETLTVKADTAIKLALSQTPKLPPASGTAWTLTQPVATEADENKASSLASDFSRVEALEYVDDAPKPEDLDKKYGLAKPRYVVEATYTGPKAKPTRLEIGNARDNKPEFYARVPGSPSIFSIKKELVEQFDAGATALLKLDFWSVSSDQITELQVSRGAETYKLTASGADWKLSGPFDAPVSFPEVQGLLSAAATLKADKFDALTRDAAKHGLDQPAVKLSITYKEPKPNTMPPEEQPVTRQLLIGNPTAPGAATRFAQVEGQAAGAVFIIPDALLKEADKPALARLDKTLQSLDASRVVKVQLSGPDANQNLTLVKDEKTSTWKPEGAALPIDSPTLDSLLFAAARPPVQRLAAYGNAIKYADFGLEPAAQTITLTIGGEKPTTHIVMLGKAEPNGERYLRVQDKPAVGVLPARFADMLARGKLDFVDRNLLSFDPAGVQRLSRQRGQPDLEFTRTGMTWEITKPMKLKADQSGLSDLVETLSRLRAAKVAAFAPTDADLDSKYGLKSPTATVSIQVNDKETRVLNLGKPVDAAKPDGEYYFRVDGPNSNIVGVLNATLSQKLLAAPVKFRDRFLAKFIDADKVTITRGERLVTFTKVNGTWKLTAPITADAEQAELEELVNALANLSLDEILAEKSADLKPFGLAPPEVKLQLFGNDKPVLSLLVGTKEQNGNRVAAMLDNGELVGYLDAGLSTRVLAEYRSRTVFKDLDAAQIDGLIISGSYNLALQKQSDGQWIDTTKPMDRINAGVVTDLAAALGGLKVERYVVDDKAKLALYGLEKPTQVIVIQAKGQPARTLHLGNKVGGTNGKQVYARLPDQQAVFILSEADTAKLLVERAAFNR